ncbi:hypothetical protein [Sphingobium sp. LSP13-1-1.1]|uniref:hypothetical protein n=1 Tax=Sphingobium sp. LSP13-1-1.1 TaxID=3135234 RepID=UPI0034449AD7
MSGDLKIYDAMIEMRAGAIRGGRTPRRWEINYAGLAALSHDFRVYSRTDFDNLLGSTFLGIPMTAMPRGAKLTSDDPKVDLIVDEERA